MVHLSVLCTGQLTITFYIVIKDDVSQWVGVPGTGATPPSLTFKGVWQEDVFCLSGYVLIQRVVAR